MTAIERVLSGVKFGAVVGAFTLIPVGRLSGKPLAATCVGVGAAVGGLVGAAAGNDEPEKPREEAEAGAAGPADGSQVDHRRRIRLGVAAVAVSGAAAASGIWLTCTIDRIEENWLRRRGVRHPRPWMALAAAVVGGVSEAVDSGTRGD